MEGIKKDLQETLKRIEKLRAETKNSSSEALGQNQPLSTENSPSRLKISDEGCERCKFTGTLTNIRKVTDPNYVNKRGELIPFEKTTVEICPCRRERQFRKYDAAVQLAESERLHTFTTAKIDADNEPQYRIATDFVKQIERHLKEGTWLYIFGDEARADQKSRDSGRQYEAFGTGKTFLMHCLANAFSHRRIPALYVKEEALFGDIKATYGKGNEETEAEVLQRYYNVPILMIDDVFTAPYKDWAEGKLFSILDERDRNNKITIMTSNYTTGRIRNRLPVNGGKLASRITGKAIMIEMIGPDRRPERRQHERN